MYGHFCELLPTVLGLWAGFTWPMTLSTCLRGMTKNLSFLHFWAIFMSYCPQFWVFRVIFKAHDTWYLFDRHEQKLIVFGFMAVFVSYFPLFWGSGRFTWPVTLSTCLRGMTKNMSFLHFRAIFVSYSP
jgi:hypothetical protein